MPSAHIELDMIGPVAFDIPSKPIVYVHVHVHVYEHVHEREHEHVHVQADRV